MNLYVLLSEQFGAASVRKAPATAMQSVLSAYMVNHLKSSRHGSVCLRDTGSGHQNVLILPCLDSSVSEP